jgi:nucleoside-diphosphate-sugar epimerase
LVRAVAADTRLPLTVIRPFSFSGKGDAGTRLFPSILHAAALAQPAELSSGEQIRDHCAVNDIARGVLLAIARHSPGSNRGDIFNLGSGRTEALRQVIEGVVEELGLDVSLAFGARSPAPFEPQFLAADISHAQQELGWRPEINFAHAVWELARESFPTLKLREPKKHL